jgi:polysaccharide deacetylase family protein (PEP-CTERM system associated)
MEKTNVLPKALLFSIDFEDIRYLVPDGFKYQERLPAMMHQYLAFLRERNSKGTFFVVGKAAELYPYLVKEIIAEGHEIGCHTYEHQPLNFHTPQSFREDMLRNVDVLDKLGASNIFGFRAPGLSLTEKTKWAYEVLEDLGFKYSSSVMATRSAFHGWPEFGTEFKLVDGKIWELPPTLLPNKYFSIPFASSVYFRFLPALVSGWAMRNAFHKLKPVISYFHSFDIDFEQERFMHPGVNGSILYNFLMYYNRKGMLEKFKGILPEDVVMMPHYAYIEKYLSGNPLSVASKSALAGVGIVE